MAEGFTSPRRARLVHRFGFTAGLAFDLRIRWDLNDPAQRAKKCGHICNTKGLSLFGAGVDEVDDGHLSGKLLKHVCLYINILENCFGMLSFVQ